MSEKQLYTVECRDNRGRWHRPRSVRFMFAADAVTICASAYPHGWRVLDADGRQIADHLGNGLTPQLLSI